MKISYKIDDRTENTLKKIFVRVRDGRKFDKVAWTEKYVHVKMWNPEKEEVRNKTIIYNPKTDVDFQITESKEQINNYLQELKIYLLAKYNEDYSKSLTIQKHWLKDALKSFNNRIDISDLKSPEYFFSSWLEKWLNNPKNLISQKNAKPLSEDTIRSYKSALNKFKDFEEYQNKNYRFEELTHDGFYKEFVYYCRNDRNLNDNSIGKAVVIFKKFFLLIKDEGLPINLDFEKGNKFTGLSNETENTYLNVQEVDRIYNLDFSNNERLDNVRDMFIIGLWTGLRISDFKRLDVSNVKNGIISIETQKTKKRVAIGIHPQIKAILEKRNGEFPKAISDQKFNDYVKEVCELAEINEITTGSKVVNIGTEENKVFRKVKGYYPKWELITSHTCRRSMITNFYKTKKLPLSTLMSLSGHGTESQFLQYVKLTPEENAQLMNDYMYNKLDNNNLVAPLQIAK